MDLQSRPLSATIQEPAGISLEFFMRYHPLNEDPFPVPPFDVTRILKEFRGAFGLLLGKLAGTPLVRYFKCGLTGRNLPGDLGRSVGCETVCPRKVRLFCSGLASCTSTDAVQHSLQRCKTPSPNRNVWVANTPSPKRSVGLQNTKP